MKGSHEKVTCGECGAEFEYFRIAARRKYCSQACRDTVQRRQTRRAYYERSRPGLSREDIMDLMRANHKRKSVNVPEGYDRRDTSEPKRRCAYSNEDVAGCITILCRYNPGPYCFLHAQKISDEAAAESRRRYEREVAANQELMVLHRESAHSRRERQRQQDLKRDFQTRRAA